MWPKNLWLKMLEVKYFEIRNLISNFSTKVLEYKHKIEAILKEIQYFKF